MIVRLWRGWASPERADAYQAHVTTAVLPGLLKIPGYRGSRVLRRVIGQEVEFIVITEWASWDAIRAFAGEDPHAAVVEPAARAALTRFEERVAHFDVAYPATDAALPEGGAAHATPGPSGSA